MDMNNVKSIYDNSVGKEVEKIQDSNGNIIWYKVPDGYRKVEYIHGVGEQYINTGYSANANIEVELKYKSDYIEYADDETRCIIGGRKSIAGGISLWDRGGFYQYGKGSKGYPEVQKVLENANIHTVKIAKGGDLYVDGTKILTYTPGTFFQKSFYIYLFTCLAGSSTNPREDGTDKRTMIGRFYYCIVKDNNVVVRHLISMVRITDNKPGMYDLVNDVFYTNAGTGEFTWGEL